MDWKTLLWPWGAVRRLERDNAALAGELSHAQAAYLQAVDRAERMIERNGRLNSLIAVGHFRDPATGRISRKGVVPPALAKRYLT